MFSVQLLNGCRKKLSVLSCWNCYSKIRSDFNWTVLCNLNTTALEVSRKCKLTLIANTLNTAVFVTHFSTSRDEMEQIYGEKAVLREEMKQKLAKLTSEEKQRQSEIVKTKLFNHDVYKRSQRVSVFLNMDDEVQTLDILKDLLEKNKKVFIPRYSGKLGRMDMVKLTSWEDYENLPVTRWNIKQPAISEPRENALDTGGLDLTIMPGLAFTKDGRRLGRGKGYYDAFLTRANLPTGKPYTIAVAFKEQVLSHIPITPTDVLIDEILFDDH